MDLAAACSSLNKQKCSHILFFILLQNCNAWNTLEIYSRQEGSYLRKIIPDIWPCCDLDLAVCIHIIFHSIFVCLSRRSFIYFLEIFTYSWDILNRHTAWRDGTVDRPMAKSWLKWPTNNKLKQHVCNSSVWQTGRKLLKKDYFMHLYLLWSWPCLAWFQNLIRSSASYNNHLISI